MSVWRCDDGEGESPCPAKLAVLLLYLVLPVVVQRKHPRLAILQASQLLPGTSLEAVVLPAKNRSFKLPSVKKLASFHTTSNDLAAAESTSTARIFANSNTAALYSGAPPPFLG
jgi:hypothetical protein